MLDTIKALNFCLLHYASEFNPNGFYKSSLGSPSNLNELLQRMAKDDRYAYPFRVCYDKKYELYHPGVNMVAFFAMHDRLHAKYKQEFTMKGEIFVSLKQIELVREMNEDAANYLQASSKRQYNLWVNGG